MEYLNLPCKFERHKSRETITPEIQPVIDACLEATEKAYAPYSSFHVGAALLLENGMIIKGNNQENAAFPSGLCAERVAIFYAGANHPGVRIMGIAVTAKSVNYTKGEPVTPCGSCRQSLLEYELNQQSDIPIYMVSPSGEVIVSKSIKQLLPLYFEHSGRF
jgi:cytidine deaminase